MHTYKTIFTPAEMLIPQKDNAERWAVIACDQFTSEMSYWNECASFVGTFPSAYGYILPEAYLTTEKEAAHNAKIRTNMENFDGKGMIPFDGIVYLERTLPDGSVRHGIVGKLDLEAYSYAKDSASPIRATEATVLERIPPRCKVRSEAAIELPHILILIEDKKKLFPALAAEKDAMDTLYDFDLMLGGGHVHGYAVKDEKLDALMELIAAYEAENAGGVVYAMGDGNHSLAAAKAHYENLKAAHGADAVKDHPARWALCEITSLEDESLVFEPIYRLLINCDPADVLRELTAVTGDAGEQKIHVIADGQTKDIAFTSPTHALTVGTLQNFIDAYCAAHPGVTCDYIHGDDTLRQLAENENTVGFLFDGMDKGELFPYVDAHGTLPRKTFSMGEAKSKRYYLEARVIR
ncbi:MAG: DUF1015 domain-containing protein [Ruminococcaceae bacterium]|nr:DUF1015 domain-containing protein [Oscillospiraceae bacterium]